jgi:hypothetical protein
MAINFTYVCPDCGKRFKGTGGLKARQTSLACVDKITKKSIQLSTMHCILWLQEECHQHPSPKKDRGNRKKKATAAATFFTEFDTCGCIKWIIGSFWELLCITYWQF